MLSETVNLQLKVPRPALIINRNKLPVAVAVLGCEKGLELHRDRQSLWTSYKQGSLVTEPWISWSSYADMTIESDCMTRDGLVMGCEDL